LRGRRVIVSVTPPRVRLTESGSCPEATWSSAGCDRGSRTSARS
jgi:hypothetical protein